MSFIQKYRRDASNRFNNYGGQGIYDGDIFNRADGSMPGPLANPDFQQMNPNNSQIIYTVSNASSTTATATLFGAVYDLTDAQKPNQLTYGVQSAFSATNTQLKTFNLTAPFRILGLKVFATTAAQLENQLNIYSQTPAGGGTQANIVNLAAWKSAMQNQTTQIDAATFQYLVLPTTYIQFTINGNESMTFIFQMVQEVNQAASIMPGSAPVKVLTTPAPTGLPTVDGAVANVAKSRLLRRPGMY